MCQHIVQFCSGSTKPLLIAGSFITLLLAIAIGYTACNTNSLYLDLDPQVAKDNALSYYLQLAASLYLLLISLLGCLAAHYDEKHSMRALALVSALNFGLAVVAIMMMPSGQDIAPRFATRLEEAKKIYDFTDKPKLKIEALESVKNLPTPAALKDEKTGASNGPDQSINTIKSKLVKDSQENQLDAATATKIWDDLQGRGCCGFKNFTEDWPSDKGLPKSCCCHPIEKDGKFQCSEVDAEHQRPCLELIGAKSYNLMIILALIALGHLYLATVSGISAFRTLHYNEASQNAYS